MQGIMNKNNPIFPLSTRKKREKIMVNNTREGRYQKRRVRDPLESQTVVHGLFLHANKSPAVSLHPIKHRMLIRRSYWYSH